MTDRRSFVPGLLAGLTLCLGLAGTAAAQGFPSKPIRLIVPFPAGSAPDAIARAVGQHMQGTLGQPIIIDNKPGANGMIAAQETMRSAPDGYTIFGGNNTTLAAIGGLYKKPGYDPKDFAPIGLLVRSSLMLVVRPDYPANNMKEFLARARSAANPLTVGYASAGMQVSIGEMEGLGKIRLQGVPYKGVPQAVADVLGGQIDFTFSDMTVGLGQVRGGKMKGLGLTQASRSPLIPEMPAIGEDIPGFNVGVWSGLAAPPGTPRDVVDKLWAAAQKAVNDPATFIQLQAAGQEKALMDPDTFKAYIVSETARWTQQIKAAGIEPE
ncbi:MAG: tripartite tricarboxylate transporter substrate binding protein [Pseudomonadota bacterium]